MEIGSTSRGLHLFPTEQRFKIKHVGCKLIVFSDVSSLPINPKLDISTRNRKEEERYNAMAAPKKRNKLSEEEEEAPNKRQKKTIEQDLAKVVAKPEKSITAAKVSKPEKSIKALRLGGETKTNSKVTTKSVTLSRIRLHETKTKPIDEEIENQSCSLRDLIAKAKNKVQEKRQIDGRREYIASQRLAARLNQIVATVAFDDHLKYHRELEQQLGCGFIHEQVSCLSKFSFLSKSDHYVVESSSSSSSVLETAQPSRSDGDSSREKQNMSTTKDESMESSLQDSGITKDDVIVFRSSESTNQRKNSSTIERIQ